MKKIFTLIAAAAMAVSAQAQGIAWAFNTTPDAAPDITDESFSGGSVAVSGQDASYQEGAGFRVQTPSAGDNSGIPFISFQPLDVDAGVTVEWTATVAAGKSATLKKINLNMARFGTDGGTIDLSYKIDGGEAVVLDEGLIPARNNKTQADDAKGSEDKYTARYTKSVRGAAAATSSITLIAKWTDLGVTKQIGYALVSIQTGDATPTGIQTVTGATAADAPLYNLAGQQVDSRYKGIVIQNGKKVVVK